jgi:hypothetical protein
MIYFLPFAKKIKKRIKKKEKEKWPMGFFPQGRYTLLYYLILEGITNCQKMGSLWRLWPEFIYSHPV